MDGGGKSAEKHRPADEMIKELDNMLSRMNAMEIVASSDHERDSIRIMRALAEGLKHSTTEFQHLKKAIDLLTLQLFETQNKIRDR